MAEQNTHLEIAQTPTALLARIRCEKVGARESQIIETDLKTAAPAKHWRMALDLTEVTLLASMGLGMLVSLHKLCSKEGGKLAVFGVKPEIVELLRLTHLDRILRIVGDRDAALKAVG